MHNFKKVLKTFLVLVVCVALLAALDLALYPCTFMRNDVHAVVTQQFDDIIVGTSHGKMDIDPEVMQEVPDTVDIIFALAASMESMRII